MKGILPLRRSFLQETGHSIISFLFIKISFYIFTLYTREKNVKYYILRFKLQSSWFMQWHSLWNNFAPYCSIFIYRTIYIIIIRSNFKFFYFNFEIFLLILQFDFYSLVRYCLLSHKSKSRMNLLKFITSEKLKELPVLSRFKYSLQKERMVVVDVRLVQ